MSHFTTVKTRMTDIECIKSALDYLNFNYEVGDCAVKNYEGKTEQVELAIRTGTNYDIGFCMNENEYEIVADWWGVKNYAHLEEKVTVDKIRQRYSFDKIMKEQKELEKQGFRFAKAETTEENVEVITLRSY
jgi:hypothetical protein